MHTNIEAGRGAWRKAGATASAMNSRRFSRLDLPELRDAADLHPLADEDVASMIEPRTVGRDELARFELAPVRRHTQLVLSTGVSAVAEVRDHLVAVVV